MSDLNKLCDLNHIANVFGVPVSTLEPMEDNMDYHTDPRHEPAKPEPDPDYGHDKRVQAKLDGESEELHQVRLLVGIAKRAMAEAQELISRLERESAVEAKQLLDEVRYG